MFQNINNVLFDRPLTLKCNCWMKRWNTNSLECDHEFWNNNMHKRISKFQNLDVIHSDDMLKTCDLWLHAIDSTKNIKSLSNIQFEIKNKTLKMFLITKWENFISLRKKIKFKSRLMIFYFFPIWICTHLQVLMNCPQINHLFKPFSFLGPCSCFFFLLVNLLC
jgi:hypothetical protein